MCHIKDGTSLHHKAHQKGFNMFRYFMSLCNECHMWIHEHEGEAKKLGLLIEANPLEQDFELAIKSNS